MVTWKLLLIKIISNVKSWDLDGLLNVEDGSKML